MAFVSSSSIKVYPTGYRDKQYNNESFVNSESNLNSLADRVVDSSSYISKVNNDDTIEFVVKGYLFKTTKNAITDLFSGASEGDIIYARVNIKNVIANSTTYSTLLPSGLSDVGILDVSAEFKGVEFIINSTSTDDLSLYKKGSSDWDVIESSKLKISSSSIFNSSGDTKKSIAEEFTTNTLTVNSNINLPNGAIVTADIADSAITTSKINTKSVTTGKLSDYAVTSLKIYDGAVTTEKISNGAVTTAKIATDAIINRVAGEVGDSDGARHVWFSHLTDSYKRVYNDKFKYNPYNGWLTVGSGVECVYSFRVDNSSAYSGNYIALQKSTNNKLGLVYRYNGSDSTLKEVLTVVRNTENGNGLKIGADGLTIIGAGESQETVAGQVGQSGSNIDNWGTEDIYITADKEVKFLSNLDDGWSSRKQATLHADGSFEVYNGPIKASYSTNNGANGIGIEVTSPDGIKLNNSYIKGTTAGTLLIQNTSDNTYFTIKSTGSNGSVYDFNDFTAKHLNTSDLGSGGLNISRPVFFANAINTSQYDTNNLVYKSTFKYNPSSDTLLVNNINLNGFSTLSGYRNTSVGNDYGLVIKNSYTNDSFTIKTSSYGTNTYDLDNFTAKIAKTAEETDFSGSFTSVATNSTNTSTPVYYIPENVLKDKTVEFVYNSNSNQLFTMLLTFYTNSGAIKYTSTTSWDVYVEAEKVSGTTNYKITLYGFSVNQSNRLYYRVIR